jgi:hypothetical protein
MTDKPRPATLGIKVGRTDSECLGRSSDSKNNNCEDRQQGAALSPLYARNVKTPYVEDRGNGADHLLTAMRAAAALALVIDGPQAFECPQSTAAVHEAGHCVMDALNGDYPARASIWPIVELGRTQWIGRTEGVPPWRVDARTPAEDDLKQAQSQLAGVVAEALFDSYRLGSSIDEIVISQSIVRTAAIKMLLDTEGLWLETLDEVVSKLKPHEGIVRNLANELMHKGSIKARRLRALLLPIRGH